MLTIVLNCVWDYTPRLTQKKSFCSTENIRQLLGIKSRKKKGQALTSISADNPDTTCTTSSEPTSVPTRNPTWPPLALGFAQHRTARLRVLDTLLVPEQTDGDNSNTFK